MRGTEREDHGDNNIQEDFSEAYLKAVASAAGLEVVSPGRDNKGFDRSIPANGFAWDNGAELRIQLKCPTNFTWSSDHTAIFHLKKQRYERLRTPGIHLPLLVLVTPSTRHCETWVEIDDNLSKLHAIAYFSVVPYTPFVDRKTKGLEFHRSDLLTQQRLFRLLRLANDHDSLDGMRRNGERLWD